MASPDDDAGAAAAGSAEREETETRTIGDGTARSTEREETNTHNVGYGVARSTEGGKTTTRTHGLRTQQCLLLARESLPSDTYNKFLKVMAEMWKQSDGGDGAARNISTEGCIERMMRVFQGYPHLKMAFLNFTKGKSPLVVDSIDLQMQKPLDFLKRIKMCPEISTSDYHVLVNTMLDFSRTTTLDAQDVYNKVRECLMNSPELLEEFRQNYLPPNLAAFVSGDQNFNHIRVKANTRKKGLLVAEEYEGDKVDPLPDFTDKELPPRVNLSMCKRSTPSYCLLPENSKKLQSSYQTELGRSVLNHHYVSVTSGSEDQDRFKKKQTENGAEGEHDRKPGNRNKCEEDIFRAENDMFEADLALERFRATADFITTLQDHFGGDTNIKDHLTPMHRRCIERLYDTYGLEMLDTLLETENASDALAVLLSRLNQKIKDLSEARFSLHKTCSGIINGSYYRSLDHRSSSFKQMDTRRMSEKALLAEANEINKTNLDAGDKYADTDMHEDISSIISYAYDSEDTQMMRWTKLVQPFLSDNFLWTDLKEKVSPRDACEHCGINKDFLMSMPNDVSSNTSDSKKGESPKNKFSGCSSSVQIEIEEGEFIPDAENICSDDMCCPSDGLRSQHMATDTSDNVNESEDQHESKQDPKRSVKPRGSKAEICCSLVVIRRIYQILHERLQLAKRLSCTRDLYAEFKEKLRCLLDRSINSCNFEYFCLKNLGPESFQLFNLDKLINRVIKQIHIVSSSDHANTLLQFLENLSRPSVPEDVSQHQNSQCPSYGLLKHDGVWEFRDPLGSSGNPKQNHSRRRKRSKTERGAVSSSQS